MSAKRNTARKAIPGMEVEPPRVVHCWRRGYIGFKTSFFVIRDVYDDTADDVAQISACTVVSSLVEDINDWNLGGISL